MRSRHIALLASQQLDAVGGAAAYRLRIHQSHQNLKATRPQELAPAKQVMSLFATGSAARVA